MKFETTARIEEMNGIRCSNGKDAEQPQRLSLKHAILSFDLNQLPEGDVDSELWLGRLLDAFMTQDFTTLPDGVRLWELVDLDMTSSRVHQRDKCDS